MQWEKSDKKEPMASKNLCVYRCGPYTLETEPMGEIDGDQMWNASIMRDHWIGSVEVWGVGSEQELITLCEKAARATGLLEEK